MPPILRLAITGVNNLTDFDQLTGPRPAALQLPAAQLQALERHLRSVWPEEGCGLLAGEAGLVKQVLPVENTLHSQTRFVMAGGPMVTAMLNILNAGWQLCAIYHSHPAGPARLSPTDLAQLTYPETVQLVVSLAQPEAPQLGAFWVASNGIEAVPIQIV